MAASVKVGEFARQYACNTGKMPSKTSAEYFSHAETDMNDIDETDMEFVEVDPTGRYGRYAEILGEGACKIVYRAFDKLDGMEVAWNQVKVQVATHSSKDLERLSSEVHLLKTLKNRNVIKCYDSWVDTRTKNVNFITELFTSGNLRQYRKKHKHVDLNAIKSWAKQILRGLLYLHSHDPPIIHRDIKCNNIFVNGNNGEVKIGDLGLAIALKQTHAAHSVIGTPEFMAPELYEEEYTELVDIYSFGMCLLELITLEYPYSECKNAAQIYKKVTTGKKPAALEKVKDPQVRSFVEKCLADASCRLSARELLMDPFLQTPENIETVVSLSPRRTDEMTQLSTFVEKHTTASEYQVQNRNKEDLSHSSQITDLTHSNQVSGSLFCDLQTMDFEMHKGIKERSTSNLGKPYSRRSQQLGNIKADDDIRLNLFIGNKEGHFRYLEFTFNTEADTALSVASEMILELGLFDYDVNTIAEQIDSKLLALIPDWKAGAAFDESFLNNENFSDQLLDADGCTGPQKDSVGMEAFCIEGLNMEPDFSHQSSDSRTVSSSDSTISCDFPTIDGLFDEVPYNSFTSDDSCQSIEFRTFSSDNFDSQDVGDIKDLRSELIASSTLNPATVEEGKVIYCCSTSSTTSSKAEAAVAFKFGWADSLKVTSCAMHRKENSSCSNVDSKRKSQDTETQSYASEPSDQQSTYQFRNQYEASSDERAVCKN
ncbi:hypothetical protein O6H91_19G011300 [Diphasiastrum complanatum]|uniref:Uncharacterized protein n=1 Tax=Diphasiastrum complanatum TaxID=34168 RepID=A0ACC2ATI6_DIPCM|nr:hypothetical protein O6H91_19G011300 [Diphasiastrum complanatum]